MKSFKNIKIIIVDIDGTLTNNEQEISNYTKEIITKAKEKGLYVIICSGRPNTYATEKSKLSNASSLVISNNGTLIFDYINNTVIFESSFSDNLIKKLWDFASENNICCTFNSIFERFQPAEIPNNNYIKNATRISSIEDIDYSVTQAVVNCYDYDKMLKVNSFLKDFKELEVSNTNLNHENVTGAYFMDINLTGNSKGKAIEILLDYLNINKNETICFGDQMNDSPMFKVSGIKVAMKNATNELKEQADYITEYSNDEDGVAKFIEKYIL